MYQTKSNWIWLEDWTEEEQKEAVLAYFRRDMELQTVPEKFIIRISADTRYKLYINGVLCEIGPAKGDRQVWFYDEIDVAPFLKPGHNIWAVMVLRYPLDDEKSNMSLFRTKTPGLYIESTEKTEAGDPLWSSDRNWKAKKEEGFHIVSENPYFAPMQIYENRIRNTATCNWMQETYDDSHWENAKEYDHFDISWKESPGNLHKRPIPYMRRTRGRFASVERISQSVYSKEDWNRFLRGERSLLIPPHTTECVDLDAGELMTGFLRIFMKQGKGTKFDLLQAECYVQEIPEINSYDDLPAKGDRTDSSTGLLAGNHDVYYSCGSGSDMQEEIYEPFWFRTFRFVRLKVETGEEALELKDFDYLETGYPLEIKTRVKTSDTTMEKIWDISERSLKRCMHETYEDCPFYEQLQYAMDSRNQILYTYAVSADDRLARQCMDDFRRSQRYDGLLTASYPCTGVNVIPGFSVFYIGMVYDHMMYFGDRDYIEEHLPAIDGILQFFHKHRNEKGLVEKIGDLNRPDCYWSFIDWTPQWKATNGVPSATLKGSITMESFLYLLGLQYASALNRYVGRIQTAEAYEKRAEQLQKAINTWCKGEKGLYQDGPGYEEYSQHCQVFAVLTDTVSVEEGRAYLQETLNHKEKYAQCSVAMMYYLFRALEKCGIYEKTEELWGIWREMLNNHMTTCAEDPLDSRSDCHAWGALILFELPSVILGVRPAEPGYKKVFLNPMCQNMEWAKGEVMTPKGIVKVNWEKTKEGIKIETELPEGMEIAEKKCYNL